MKVLYLGEHGPTKIRLLKEGLAIGERAPVPPPEFDYDTVLIGNTKGFVSFPALKTLGRWGVTVGLMGRGGTPLSTFVPWTRNDAALRLAQMRASLDPRKRMLVARAFVSAKLGVKLSPTLDTLTKLRHYEAEAAMAYWAERGVARRSGFYRTLNARATTPTNAAVNYAQGVHSVVCRRAIAKVGLDPCVGFLHVSAHDKEAFVYDAQELARAQVDEVALRFVRERPQSFLRDDDWVYRLTNEGARELALRTCDALSREVPYRGMRVSVEGVLVRELRALGAWCVSPTRSLKLFSFTSEDARLSKRP